MPGRGRGPLLSGQCPFTPASSDPLAVDRAIECWCSRSNRLSRTHRLRSPSIQFLRRAPTSAPRPQFVSSAFVAQLRDPKCFSSVPSVSSVVNAPTECFAQMRSVSAFEPRRTQRAQRTANYKNKVHLRTEPEKTGRGRDCCCPGSVRSLRPRPIPPLLTARSNAAPCSRSPSVASRSQDDSRLRPSLRP